MSEYDKLVDKIREVKGRAIIDIHNYARWYCSVIEQPDVSFPYPSTNVTNQHFADLWTRLATRYNHDPSIYYQLMNEPHDLNITKWATTTQTAINAIRATGSKNPILVSGTQYARLVNWPLSSASGIAPGKLHDPVHNLIWDSHQYFDDTDGAYGLCEPFSIFEPALQNVTQTLREAGVQGMITEFGGGALPQCVDLFNRFLTFLDRNSDVWHGWTAWGSPGDNDLSPDPKNPQYKLVEVLRKYTRRANS